MLFPLLDETVGLLLVLLPLTCVIAVIAYLVTRTSFFQAAIHHRATLAQTLILVVVFGAVSVYGTLSNVEILGAPVNVRDLGPMVAGLSAGPVVGIGAGIIGAVFRLSMGGFTMIPCSLATVIAGGLAGVIYLLAREKFIGTRGAVLFAGVMECLHMVLALLLARPFDRAVALVSQIAVPMIFANAIGIFIFSFIIENYLKEEQTRSERDRLHDELERKNAEMAIAREIQVSFLPDKIPPVPGFDLAVTSLPAREVGGDFYDAIIPVGKDKIGLLIADVSGKGVPAALFMALSRTVTRANATWHSRATDAIRDANEMITQDAKYGMFVTLFFGVVSPNNREFTYVNAGHNPPLLFHADKTFEELFLTGPALGVIPGAGYEEGVRQLLPGDTLVFYTDGVTEAINTKSEEFGKERLRHILAARSEENAGAILASVLKAVQDFSEGMPQFDDITLMVLKVER